MWAISAAGNTASCVSVAEAHGPANKRNFSWTPQTSDLILTMFLRLYVCYWSITSQIDEGDTYPFTPGIWIHLYCPLSTISVLISSRGGSMGGYGCPIVLAHGWSFGSLFDPPPRYLISVWTQPDTQICITPVFVLTAALPLVSFTHHFSFGFHSHSKPFFCATVISLFSGNKVAGKCKLLLALFMNLCKVCLAVTGPDKFWLPTSRGVKPWHHVLPHLHGVWLSPKHLTRRFISHYVQLKISNASLHWKSCQQVFSDLLQKWMVPLKRPICSALPLCN